MSIDGSQYYGINGIRGVFTMIHKTDNVQEDVPGTAKHIVIYAYDSTTPDIQDQIGSWVKNERLRYKGNPIWGDSTCILVGGKGDPNGEVKVD